MEANCARRAFLRRTLQPMSSVWIAPPFRHGFAFFLNLGFLLFLVIFLGVVPINQLLPVSHRASVLRSPVLRPGSRVVLSPDELARFALSQPNKTYTRNVVARDPRFTLLCLVWRPGVTSCIHDHPRAGCWVRVLSGSLEERQFRPVVNRQNTVSTPGAAISPAAAAAFVGGAGGRMSGGTCGDGAGAAEEDSSALPLLEETQRLVARAGDVTYIDDHIGYHCMSNPSPITPAVTLHLYSPEYGSCKVWMDSRSPPTEKAMTYDSYPATTGGGSAVGRLSV
ncbi:unnamed protein product [Phaeothamnion confervicola]